VFQSRRFCDSYRLGDAPVPAAGDDTANAATATAPLWSECGLSGTCGCGTRSICSDLTSKAATRSRSSEASSNEQEIYFHYHMLISRTLRAPWSSEREKRTDAARAHARAINSDSPLSSASSLSTATHHLPCFTSAAATSPAGPFDRSSLQLLRPARTDLDRLLPKADCRRRRRQPAGRSLHAGFLYLWGWGWSINWRPSRAARG
jgi:hypothetical protein